MTDISAIAGSLFGYKTMADGGLRITIDLPQTESGHFHGLFPSVHCPVAIAPLNPVDLAKQQEAQPEQPARLYGSYAKALKTGGFLGWLDVWRATGSDDTYLEFVRTQKCVARSGVPCDGPVQAAHVWRLKDDFGKGVKGPYAAVPLCAGHHRHQHNSGEDAIGGREYMEKKRYETVTNWIWATIKKDIGVESMADAEPAQVLAWAQERQIDRFLPPVYREHAQ
jgi:hypothetical protein